jgi:PDZ domain-containing protein
LNAYYLRRIPFAAWAAFGIFFVGVALALVPTPYWIIAPGNAVDLRSRVRVEGYPAPRDRYFLTDVQVLHASLLTSFARYLPGVRLVRQDALIPKGIVPAVYDTVLVQEMSESQDAAAFVAERAAGLRVERPPTHVYVAAILPNSKAGNVLRVGDVLLSVSGLRIAASGDVAASIMHLKPGTNVPLSFRRGGHVENSLAPTVSASPRPGSRLGILLRVHPEKAVLPIPVRCSLDDISGSSGGLMVALQIYGSLHPDRKGARRSAAGTGTIGYDGTVGPVDGAGQKVIAAQRAGLRVFLVPRQNYREAAAAAGHGMRVIAVDSFDEARAALSN